MNYLRFFFKINTNEENINKCCEIIEINAQIATEQQEAMIKQVEMMQQQMSLGIQPEQQDGGQPPPQQ